MPNGTLSGYAIPVTTQVADHTYVLSDQGHSWGCWGRSAGGQVICAGTGNTSQADCLSQPNSHAGITYAFTGVCHQTANRILYPTSANGQLATVSQARGARLSYFMYGVYGLDPTTLNPHSPLTSPWPELQICASAHVHP
jgi:hypothetical protein